jgi:hypothetical protein
MTNAERERVMRDLSERQREVLEDLPSRRWVRPMDIGGRDASDHSRVLASLVRLGLALVRRRGEIRYPDGLTGENALARIGRGPKLYRTAPLTQNVPHRAHQNRE